MLAVIQNTMILQSTLIAGLILGILAYIVAHTFEPPWSKIINIILAVIFLIGWIIPLLTQAL